MTDDEIAGHKRTLNRLISNYEAAEADHTRLSRRPMPPYMEAARGAPGMTEAQWLELEEAYEVDSGLLAASDASDAAYERLITFTGQLLGQPSLSRDALRLKATACLFAAPLHRLREDGYDHIATLMEQLAAPEVDVRPPRESDAPQGNELLHDLTSGGILAFDEPATTSGETAAQPPRDRADQRKGSPPPEASACGAARRNACR